jgi:5-(carboxyamino)imidazole ribonucleotide synthase
MVSAFDDVDAVEELARDCDVVTIEFENPPAAALDRLTDLTRAAPSARAVSVCQDRRAEKRFLQTNGVPVGPFHVIEGPPDITTGPQWLEHPCVVKTARFGYDGKGQVNTTSRVGVHEAWRSLGQQPCVVEAHLPLEAELSVVIGRDVRGDIAAFDVAENTHRHGILDLTVVPARIDVTAAQRAVDMACSVADELEYVGVLAVELFVVDGTLMVNELAPRPHNSGHWTIDGAQTSQFEQQIRAVCGTGLGSTRRGVGAAAMANLLGELWAHGEPSWERVLADPAAHLHLYGKREPRPGRKMGHLTVLGSDQGEVAARAIELRAAAVHGRP